jgi:hypothetical protein
MMMLYLFVWLVEDILRQAQYPTMACYFILSNTCNGGKRSDDTLLIRVVGGEETPTKAC